MLYIIVDFEWNQPLFDNATIQYPFRFDSEIIEIGAVKLNEDLEIVDEFQSFVKPKFYPVMNGGVSRLTKIRAQNLSNAPLLPEVYNDFSKWCGDDFTLCTWGPDDIPALLDNLIMHGIAPASVFYWCDLQEIFGTEIMRDGKQWALVAATDLLKLQKDRAHDALNDARNTYRICSRVDLLQYCSYYENCCVNYRTDRMKGLISGRHYDSADSVLQDDDMVSMVCPCCGETVRFKEWVKKTKRTNLSYGQCNEGYEFLARYQKKKTIEGYTVISRMVYAMNDVLWDDYLDALDRESEVTDVAI